MVRHIYMSLGFKRLISYCGMVDPLTGMCVLCKCFCFEYSVCDVLTCVFQDVWLVPDSFLFWLHGFIQPRTWDNVRNSGLRRNKRFCKEDILYCENRLS